MYKILIFLLILVSIPISVTYTPYTNTCVGCHDGSIAQYKRPHNDTVMCEKCHNTDVHNMKYIQPNGTLGDKSTAATCIDCHEKGVSGFNSPIIPNTKHNITALGKIKNLTDDPTNIRNGSISITTWCADCHYNGLVNNFYRGDLWSPAPPLINVQNTEKWVNHTNYLNDEFGDIKCRTCHINGGQIEFSNQYVHSIG